VDRVLGVVLTQRQLEAPILVTVARVEVVEPVLVGLMLVVMVALA
jgi:hypothetical protein